MAYIETWNAAFEASPAGSDDAMEGDEKIRGIKVNIRERFAKDHYFDIAGTDADHGEHNKCTLREQGSDPVTATNKGFIYTKDDGSGNTELYYRDAAGNVIKITAVGLLADRDIPSTAIILFDKNTVVAGYTLLTDVDDRLLFITKGSVAGGETGGASHSTGTWTISGVTANSHTHTMGNHVHSLEHTHQMGNHTHTMKSHTHAVSITSGKDQNHTGDRGSSGTYDYIYNHDHAVSGNTGVPSDNTSDGPSTDTSGGASTTLTSTPSTNLSDGPSTQALTSNGTWRPLARCFTRQQRN